jgi:hypothetical protein
VWIWKIVRREENQKCVCLEDNSEDLLSMTRKEDKEELCLPDSFDRERKRR